MCAGRRGEEERGADRGGIQREPEGARNRRVTSGNPAFLQANGAEGRRGGGEEGPEPLLSTFWSDVLRLRGAQTHSL